MDAGIVAVAFLAAVALAVNKTVSVIKALVNRDTNGFVTPLVVWTVGIGAVALLAHADLSSGMTLPALNVTFGSLDGASQVLLGWVLGGTGSFAFDLRKAVDRGDSAAEASLIK